MILRNAQMIMLDILVEVDRICRKHKIEYYISDGTLLGAVRHKGFIPWDDDLDISMTRENYEKFEKVAPSEISKDYFVQTVKNEKNYTINGCPMKIRHMHSLLKETGVEGEVVEYNEGIYIDVFPLDIIPSNKLLMKFQKILIKLFLMIKSTAVSEASWKNVGKKLFKNVSYATFQKILRSTLWINKKYPTNKYTYGVDTYWYGDFSYDKKNVFPLQELEFENHKVFAPAKPDVILTELYGDYMQIPPVEKRETHALFIEIYDKCENDKKHSINNN